MNISTIDDSLHDTSTPPVTSRPDDTQEGGFPEAVNIFYTCGESVIALVTVFGNGLVLYVIAKFNSLRTFTNYFIASLAAADMLVGFIGIPCSIIAFYGLPPGFWGCLFMNTTIIMLTQISIFGLVTISLERYVAIQYPFFYEKHCNGKSAIVIISVTWTLAILVGFVPVFGWNNQNEYSGDFCNFTGVVNMYYMVFFNFFGFVLFPLLIMFSVYCYIFHTVRKQLTRIASLEIPTVSNSSATSAPTNNHLQAPNNNNSHFKSPIRQAIHNATHKVNMHSAREKIRRELRAAKWFAFVILLFAVCWLPLHIMNTISLLAYPVQAPLVVTAIMLSHLNSAVNPVLYAYSNTKFKTAMKKVLYCKAGHGIHPLDNSGNYFTHSVNGHQPSAVSRTPSVITAVAGHNVNSEVASSNRNEIHCNNSKRQSLDENNSVRLADGHGIVRLNEGHVNEAVVCSSIS